MRISNLFQGDRGIWGIYFLLCVISLVEVFSAASTLSYENGSFWEPLIKQALFLGVGTVVVLVLHNIPCRFFKLVPIIFLPLSALLLLLTSLVGGAVNGGARWLSFGFIQFQPSELAKGAVIATVALILAHLQREDGAERRAFKYIVGITGAVCALIMTENLSTAVLLFGVVVLMMFIGRVSMVLLAKMAGVGLILVMLLLSVIFIPSEDSAIYKNSVFHRALTWKHRLVNHNDKDMDDPHQYKVAENAQVAHANIAIASSNLVGRMPGNSVQRDFLSAAYSDFIFAIIAEELGIWGVFIVVALYIWLLVRAGRIASRCERNFPAFLVMGLALLLVSQAVLNMMVATSLFPVTGQPLPLISRGGTSTLITCAYIGMILSVSRYSRKSKENIDPFTQPKPVKARRDVPLPAVED